MGSTHRALERSALRRASRRDRARRNQRASATRRSGKHRAGAPRTAAALPLPAALPSVLPGDACFSQVVLQGSPGCTRVATATRRAPRCAHCADGQPRHRGPFWPLRCPVRVPDSAVQRAPSACIWNAAKIRLTEGQLNLRLVDCKSRCSYQRKFLDHAKNAVLVHHASGPPRTAGADGRGAERLAP